jgi:hypothetical protein
VSARRRVPRSDYALKGRAKLKDAKTLAHLLGLLEPFRDGRAPEGVKPFRGVEAAMALNHLHRLRRDPLKDAAQQEALERQVLSFARMVEADMDTLSPKNIAWALNALKGREGFQSLFEAAAARLCHLPSAQWSIQSAALISNAFAHGTDGRGRHDSGEILVPDGIVSHLSRIVQQLLLAAALDQLNLRGGGGAAATASMPPVTELRAELRHLSITANAFSKLLAVDDDLFDSIAQV